METLLSQFTSFNVEKYVGVEDAADKASFLFSVAILVVCSVIISAKQYILTDISCYIPVMTTGSDLEDYITNYCWVHGTIPFRGNETLPQTMVEWQHYDDTRRLNYYQWVPFVLGLQGVLFYLPRLIWKTIVCNLSGTDLEGLIVSTEKANKQIGKSRKETVEQIAKCLEDMFFQRRFMGHSKLANTRQKLSIICCSRRTGLFLVMLYFFIKLLYFANAIGQIFLMQHFLRSGTSQDNKNFGWAVLKDIISGKQWNDNLFFPRVSFCFVQGISLVASKNNYVAQCALPINMLNEKIYIFLWFWTIGIAILTIISIPLWIMRMTFLRSRKNFIKKFLKVKCTYTKEKHRDLVSKFTLGFLRYDGIFILHIISLNAGDLVASDVVAELWDIFLKYHSESDFRKRIISKDNKSKDENYV